MATAAPIDILRQGESLGYQTANPFTGVTITWQGNAPPVAPANNPVDLNFFNGRHGVTAFHEILWDTFKRQTDFPRRKADLQRLTSDRRARDGFADWTRDDWAIAAPSGSEGLFQEYHQNIPASGQMSWARYLQGEDNQ